MLLAVTVSAGLPSAAVAQTAYVTDNLRLGLHQAPDTSDRAFRTLDSVIAACSNSRVKRIPSRGQGT